MEDGVLTIPSSSKTQTFSFAKAYDDAFPIYLVYGMTPHQYWDEDAVLTRHFKKAFVLRQQQKNIDQWMQGKYIHEAMVSAVSGLFAKNKSEIHPYPSEPYPMTKEEMEERERKAYEARRDKIMASFMNSKAKIYEGGQTDE